MTSRGFWKGARWLLVLALGSVGCASYIEGTFQEIWIDTMPPGADCVLEREDIPIGRVRETPGIVRVHKESEAIVVRCHKPGFETGEIVNEPSISPWFWGNALWMYGTGCVVDFAQGAHRRYESECLIPLTAKPYDALPEPSEPPPRGENEP